MTERQANIVADKAKPCPFCGQKLVAKSDHHGWWVAHRDEPGPCFDSIIQLQDAFDLERWNMRA